MRPIHLWEIMKHLDQIEKEKSVVARDFSGLPTFITRGMRSTYCNICRVGTMVPWLHIKQQHPDYVKERSMPAIIVSLSNSRKLGIGFSHTPVNRDKNGKVIPSKVTRTTKCSVFLVGQGDDRTVLGVGFSQCCPIDNFNKETGRKRSLTDALKAAKLSKDEREIVWKQYRNRPRPKSVKKYTVH